jgi:quercetin dioxygenase-like cupin family protein
MIQPGQSVRNPVTGETLVFYETASSTGGRYVRVETIARPDAFVAAAHVHPYQTERFDVIAGTLGVRVGRKKLELGAGEALDVEPGTAHRWWNAGDDELRFRCEVSPVLEFESLIEKAALALGAPLGRAVGYAPTYDPSGELALAY